ncbi:MAG TPA: hypothetical protein VFR37_11155 [Longimicrobium sp.]|nr:hypothetical protein [Longimicrobium sp.]
MPIMKCKGGRAAILGLLMTVAGGVPLGAQVEQPGVDWTRVTEHDLNVASVFLTARDRGPRAALDSLERLAARDPWIRAKGHQLAHSIGRYAMEQRKDLAVLGECTPRFQSGCFHGVLEGYFLQGGTIDRASVGSVCAGQARGFERMECWHGLGHGLMVHHAGDFTQALALCDGLEAAQPRRECQDGIFMERAIRAIGATPINVGDGPGIGHAHGAEGHEGHAAESRSASPPDDPAPVTGKMAGPRAVLAKMAADREREQMCSGLDAAHQPSCWAYQSLVLMWMYWPRTERALRVCDAAPAGAVADCYQGFGKQTLGASSGDVPKMIEACRQGDPAHLTDCLMGGVEYFTDLDWTIEPGIAFCRQVPDTAKPRCYEMIGARLTLAHLDPEPVRAACRQVEPAYVRACLAGAGMRES